MISFHEKSSIALFARVESSYGPGEGRKFNRKDSGEEEGDSRNVDLLHLVRRLEADSFKLWCIYR